MRWEPGRRRGTRGAPGRGAAAPPPAAPAAARLGSAGTAAPGARTRHQRSRPRPPPPPSPAIVKRVHANDASVGSAYLRNPHDAAFAAKVRKTRICSPWRRPGGRAAARAHGPARRARRRTRAPRAPAGCTAAARGAARSRAARGGAHGAARRGGAPGLRSGGTNGGSSSTPIATSIPQRTPCETGPREASWSTALHSSQGPESVVAHRPWKQGGGPHLRARASRRGRLAGLPAPPAPPPPATAPPPPAGTVPLSCIECARWHSVAAQKAPGELSVGQVEAQRAKAHLMAGVGGAVQVLGRRVHAQGRAGQVQAQQAQQRPGTRLLRSHAHQEHKNQAHSPTQSFPRAALTPLIGGTPAAKPSAHLVASFAGRGASRHRV